MIKMFSFRMQGCTKTPFRVILSFIPLLSSWTIGLSQHSWVYFTDKCSAEINLDDAVCNEYLNRLNSENIEVVGTSKWLNAACVKGTPKQLELLSFVRSVTPLRSYSTTQHSVQKTQEEFSYGNSDWQLEMLRLDSFHRKGYTGKGVTIALFDGGFYKADTVHAFDSLWNQGRIKGYWDFIVNDTTIFWEYDGHGKYVLSIVGANWPDSMMGAAPGANFLLARTEHVDKELHLEEYAWIKAMEWADSIGADIIHSSLGYSEFDTLEGDYTYMDMDGETTVITKATDIAFSKGIFITNSAGNEGDDPWHYITAPCDGKHVLCVGAVDSNRVHADFSSYGPSYDGRVKPDVVAMGQGVSYINNQAHVTTGSGTSFSGPLIAGFVACLKEAWPDLTNAQIYQAVIQSADRYSNPDTSYGYGLPDIIKADSLLARFASAQRLQERSLRLYPNPVTNQLTIESVSPVEEVVIYDLTGKHIATYLIDRQTITSIDLSDLGIGLFVIRTRFENGFVRVDKLEKIKN